MHDTALDLAREFFRTYLGRGPARILEIGSQDVNGAMRDVAPPGAEYVGVDIAAGRGVDIVLDDPYRFPFEDGMFDAVVSTSCFEHDQMFWLTFLEMARVARAGGYLYLNAPSNGKYHPYPVDNWRFYPDAAVALATWARREGRPVQLMESFIARRKADVWNDCVMIFAVGDTPAAVGAARLVDAFPDSYNIRRDADGPVGNFTEASEDMMLIAAAEASTAAPARAAPVASAEPSAVPPPAGGDWLSSRIEASLALRQTDRQGRV